MDYILGHLLSWSLFYSQINSKVERLDLHLLLSCRDGNLSEAENVKLGQNLTSNAHSCK